MEKFKGTKGRWHVTPYNNVFMESTRICDLDSITFCTNDEVKANAQLIAHAPEMLEMLSKVNDLFIRRVLPSESEVNQFANDIQDIIKRATTI